MDHEACVGLRRGAVCDARFRYCAFACLDHMVYGEMAYEKVREAPQWSEADYDIWVSKGGFA